MHTTHKTAEITWCKIHNNKQTNKHTHTQQAPPRYHSKKKKKILRTVNMTHYKIPKQRLWFSQPHDSSCHITSSAALPPGFVPWSLKQRSMLQPHMQTGPVTLVFSTHLFWCEHLHQVNLILLLFIFWPKDDVKGEWKRLHNEKLRDLYSSSNIIRISNQEEWDGRYM